MHNIFIYMRANTIFLWIAPLFGRLCFSIHMECPLFWSISIKFGEITFFSSSKERDQLISSFSRATIANQFDGPDGRMKIGKICSANDFFIRLHSIQIDHCFVSVSAQKQLIHVEINIFLLLFYVGFINVLDIGSDLCYESMTKVHVFICVLQIIERNVISWVYLLLQIQWFQVSRNVATRLVCTQSITIQSYSWLQRRWIIIMI